MTRHFWRIGFIGVGLWACSDPGPDPRLDSIEVFSPVDSILAQGRSHQFSATAHDANGDPISVVFSWLSSNPAAASVGGTGMVSALAPGAAEIRVTAPSEPGVTGLFAVRVVNADLPAVSTISEDVFGDALVAALSIDTRPVSQATWNACAAHAADGNISAIQRCVTDLRAQASAATDGTDRALLAVLGTFGDQIERRLAL